LFVSGLYRFRFLRSAGELVTTVIVDAARSSTVVFNRNHWPSAVTQYCCSEPATTAVPPNVFVANSRTRTPAWERRRGLDRHRHEVAVPSEKEERAPVAAPPRLHAARLRDSKFFGRRSGTLM
jgi:hypothetical protein